MTTGNDPALPAATDDTLPPVTPAADAAPGLTFTSPQPPDSDDADLTAALAEAKAEEAAGSGDGQPTTPPQDPAQLAATPPAQNPPAQQRQPVMVPIERVNDLSNKLEAERIARARAEGMLEATRTMAPAAPGQPQQPQQTPAQRLEAINAQQDALAERFDAGELTMKDFKAQERALNAQADAVKAAQSQPAPAPAQNDELYLETLTAQLEKTHPWVDVFEKVGTDADWKFLEMTAVQNMQGRGEAVDLSKTISRYNFRKEMSELATQYGPSLVAARAQAKGIVLPGQAQRQQQPPATPPGGKPPLSPQAQARLNDLTKRAGAPPDIASLPGHGGDPSGLPTEGAIEAMDDDDFDKLPNAVVNRLRGLA